MVGWVLEEKGGKRGRDELVGGEGFGRGGSLKTDEVGGNV